MVGKLITLPLRVSGKVVRLSWHAAERTANLSWGAAGFLAGRVRPERSHDVTQQPSPVADLAEEPLEETPDVAAALAHQPSIDEPAQAPLAEEPAQAPLAQEPAPLFEEPRHVSEEPELVDEFAEPGAEDGAGAEVHIREPWEGYRHMNARDVAARLRSASPSELAAIQLYESSTRGRQTILTAVTRHLRSATGNGSRA